MHGWLVIDKPVGPGSTRIVSAVKRVLRENGYPKVKVGHGGTLDPLASGVLPIALGEATKLCGRMLNADKGYDFTIRFGVETSTLDAEGEAVATCDMRPTRPEIDAIIPDFIGRIEQVPPAFSAIKLAGKPAYQRARSGEAVAMAVRTVTVHSLVRHSRESGNPASSGGPEAERERDSRFRGDDVVVEVILGARVSKGTYIRSLARDIALALGAVGHVTMLRRTRAGPFTLDQAISVDKLGELAKARSLEQALLPLTAGLDDIPALSVTPDQARALREGRKVIGTAATPGLNLATAASVPVALVESVGAELRVVRGFNL